MILGQNKARVRRRVCRFLEGVSLTWGSYVPATPKDEGPYDLMRLCCMKVTNDCRAMLVLVSHGFFIQGGIIARSAHDACNLMTRLLFEPEDTEFLEKWHCDGRLGHWDVIKAINEELASNSGIDLQVYRALQNRLHDLVHGNYPALTLYPAQSLSPPGVKRSSLEKLRFWEPLIDLCLYSCLVVVASLEPDKSQQAEELQRALVKDMPDS